MIHRNSAELVNRLFVAKPLVIWQQPSHTSVELGTSNQCLTLEFCTNSMHIRKINIEGFKTFRKFDLNLSEHLNIIVGDNETCNLCCLKR